MNKELRKLCTPARIYIIISVIASIIAVFNSVPILAVFIKLIFALIWTFILNWLCKKGFTTVSWVLVILPYFTLILATLRIIYLQKQANMMKLVE
jgi:hypothetical protein